MPEKTDCFTAAAYEILLVQSATGTDKDKGSDRFAFPK
jgi:hypothetical protein